jgi:NAD(P)-dependent dehydrogenase (short-subunit alcohol dehydrogenase family)
MRCIHLRKMKTKVALVTGGSRGIGKGIAIELAKSGYSIVITYNNNLEKAAAVCSEIKEKYGQDCMGVPLNYGDLKSIDSAFSLAQNQMGNIDILVNNAGMAEKRAYLAITDNMFDEMIAVNLKGPFFLTQKVIPSMMDKGWGRIINIASLGGQWGGVHQVHYALAKAGLINLTKSLSKLFCREGVTVNTISPGVIETDMIGQDLNLDLSEIANAIPVGRIGTTQDVASVVSYLCSNETSFITGQTINVNGGEYTG